MAADLESLERELPQSVRSLVQRKMDALDDERTGSFSGRRASIGVDFETTIMAGALDLDEADVEDRLERLEREHAIVRFVSEGEPWIAR